MPEPTEAMVEAAAEILYEQNRPLPRNHALNPINEKILRNASRQTARAVLVAALAAAPDYRALVNLADQMGAAAWVAARDPDRPVTRFDAHEWSQNLYWILSVGAGDSDG